MITKDTSIEQLVTSVRTLDENKRTVFYKIPDLTNFDPDESTINMGGSEFKFTDYALKQFLKKLKVPYNYYQSCSPDLRLKEVKEGMDTNGSPKVEYAFRVKEDKIYGMVSKAYCLHPSSHILGQVLSQLPQGLQIKEFALTLEELRVRFIAPQQEFIENDTLYSLVDIAFSEVGALPFQLTSGIHRLVCENGLMLAEGIAPSFKMPMSRFKPEILQAAVSSIPDRMFTSMNPYMNTFESLKGIELPSKAANQDLPDALVEAYNMVVPSKLIQRDYRDMMVDHYLMDQNLTLNGVVNSVTRTARDMKSRDKFKLEIAAGNFVSQLVKAKATAEQKRKPFDLNILTLRELFNKES